MQEININVNRVRFRTVYIAAVVLSLTVAVIAGMQIETAKNCIIIPVSPFEKGGFFEGIISICFWDIAAFWLFSISLSDMVKILSSSALFFFRGIVMGCAVGMLLANAVPPAVFLLLFSYVTVTFLLFVYDGFLNTGAERGPLCRLAACLVATGGCAVIRTVPMLFIK